MPFIYLFKLFENKHANSKSTMRIFRAKAVEMVVSNVKVLEIDC